MVGYLMCGWMGDGERWLKERDEGGKKFLGDQMDQARKKTAGRGIGGCPGQMGKQPADRRQGVRTKHLTARACARYLAELPLPRHEEPRPNPELVREHAVNATWVKLSVSQKRDRYSSLKGPSHEEIRGSRLSAAPWVTGYFVPPQRPRAPCKCECVAIDVTALRFSQQQHGNATERAMVQWYRPVVSRS